MTNEQQYDELIQEIVSHDVDAINACLDNHSSYIDNNFVSKVEKTAKQYKKDCPKLWAKLNLVLAAVHLYYPKNVSDPNKKINIREEGVKYHNQAFNFYEKEKCDRELAVCHGYLDTAYEQFVYNLKQYAGIVSEDESVIEAIAENNIAAAYPSLEEGYTPSDVVVEIIANTVKYSYYQKPISSKERKKWRTAYIHLYKIIEALNLYNRKHPKFNSILGEALSRNELARLVPQPKFSISYSLKLFLLYKHRIAYLNYDDYREEKPISLDIEISGDNSSSKTSLVDLLESEELIPWEKIISQDLYTQNKHIANYFYKYIETDPEQRLKKCCHKKYPQANCQAFAQQRIIKDSKATLLELTNEWQIPKGTLFDYRKGRIYDRFRRLLQAIVIEEEIKYNLSPQLIDYIKRDRANKLKECCWKKHAECNAHSLAIKRLLSEPPIRFETLAKEWKISELNIDKHWQDACLPLLQEIINSQEYL